MAKWMIRVTTAEGEDMFLWRGRTPGAGPIVQFRTKRDADINVEMVKPGLDNGEIVAVVPYDASEER